MCGIDMLTTRKTPTFPRHRQLAQGRRRRLEPDLDLVERLLKLFAVSRRAIFLNEPLREPADGFASWQEALITGGALRVW